MKSDLKTLQLFYNSVLVDSVCNYHEAGILNMITEKKALQQELTAAPQLKQLDITNPEQLFNFLSRVFGSITWEAEKNDKGLLVKGKSCLLCSIAKKRQTAQPCFIYCINPFKSFLKSMEPACHLTVRHTLWDGALCEFEVIALAEDKY